MSFVIYVSAVIDCNYLNECNSPDIVISFELLNQEIEHDRKEYNDIRKQIYTHFFEK